MMRLTVRVNKVASQAMEYLLVMFLVGDSGFRESARVTQARSVDGDVY